MRGSMSRTYCRLVVLVGTCWYCGAVAFSQEPENSDQEALASAEPSATDADASEQAATFVPMQAARFLGVTPGKTRLREVKEKLGKPQVEQVGDTSTVLQYQVGPFPKIEVFVADDVVVSIIAQLAEPQPAAELETQLGLKSLRPVAVKAAGETLGIAYPERGVMFSYQTGSRPPRVAHLVLEPLSAEMFLLRVEATPAEQYSNILEDLERVLDYDAKSAEAMWLGAKLLATTGKPKDALTLVKSAVKLAPNIERYQLTQAKFTAGAGDHKTAVAAVKRLLKRTNLSEIDRAQAELDLGELYASGLKRDYKVAIEHHLAALKAAAPLVSDVDPLIRRQAEHILIDAHLGAASDIAQGNWDRKPEVVPKWLRTAEELAAGFVQNDAAARILPVYVWRRTLETYAVMDGEVVDTTAIVEAAVETARILVEGSEDPLFQQHVQWELLQSQFAALQIARTRGRYSEALQYAGDAVQLAEQLPKDRTTDHHARYLIGRLYFYVGSVYAINHKDHSEAIRWYERALPYFDHGLPKSELFDTGTHGERFVSMGVSYWKAKLEKEALKITELGLDLMERATRAGLFDEQSLAVPYANLAEMHRAGGRDDEANVFEAKVARLERDQTQR